MEQGPLKFYRLGPTREKELFKRRAETYDGVVIPAHIASYYSKFCTEFLDSLQKPYFIDPITYIFARDSSILKRYLKDKKSGKTLRDKKGQKIKGNIKRSYKKIIEEEYKSIVQKSIFSGKSLQVDDFNDKDTMIEFVSNVVNFQKTKLIELPTKYKKYEKYAKKAGKKFPSKVNPPELIIPPYFYFDSVKSKSWYQLNLDMVNHTKDIVDDSKIFPVIFTNTELIDSSGDRIIEGFSETEPDGYILWIDQFSGKSELAVLKIVRDFVSSLSEKGKPIIGLYGDAFSLVLSRFGLTGFTCGICYGEKKSVDQDTDIEGQIPPRYYLRQLKKKIRIETEARRINLSLFPKLLCACDICKTNTNPEELSDRESKEHFMLVRADELSRLRDGLTSEEFADELQDAFDTFSNEPLFSPLTYLRNWVNILRQS